MVWHSKKLSISYRQRHRYTCTRKRTQTHTHTKRIWRMKKEILSGMKGQTIFDESSYFTRQESLAKKVAMRKDIDFF